MGSVSYPSMGSKILCHQKIRGRIFSILVTFLRNFFELLGFGSEHINSNSRSRLILNILGLFGDSFITRCRCVLFHVTKVFVNG